MNYEMALRKKVDSDFGERNCEYFFLAEIDYDITNGHSDCGKFCKLYKKQIYSCKYCKEWSEAK